MSRYVGWQDMAPKPRTLDDANGEVLRLRIALAVSNKKWGDTWAKAQMDKRAMVGQLTQLRAQLATLSKLVQAGPAA